MTKLDFQRTWISVVGIVYAITVWTIIGISAYHGFSKSKPPTHEQSMPFMLVMVAVMAAGMLSYWFLCPLVWRFRCKGDQK